jgi:hypothetical protein
LTQKTVNCKLIEIFYNTIFSIFWQFGYFSPLFSSKKKKKKKRKKLARNKILKLQTKWLGVWCGMVWMVWCGGCVVGVGVVGVGVGVVGVGVVVGVWV